MSQPVQLTLRLVAIGIVAVVLQITTISQLTLLGVSADLAPLVVMSVGLLAGVIPGAAMGFGVGLFVDLALVQTLGVTSLVLTGVGYGAGRLHELRDPAHTLLPMAIGAAATLAAVLGYSLIQLMLGADAPVSSLFFREILAVTLVNAVVALPAHAIMRRLLGAAAPQEPRRRRRRAYATGALSPLTSHSSR